MISNDLYDRASWRIDGETGIPALNVFVAASHTHSAHWGVGADVEEGIIAAAKQAKEVVQPSTISYGTGLSYLNINRDVIDPETRLWKQGPNYTERGIIDGQVEMIEGSDL